MSDSFETPMNCSLPGSSAHGISQARIVEWVAILSSRGSCRPRDWTYVSCICRWIFFYQCATWEVIHISLYVLKNLNNYSLHLEKNQEKLSGTQLFLEMMFSYHQYTLNFRQFSPHFLSYCYDQNDSLSEISPIPI